MDAAHDDQMILESGFAAESAPAVRDGGRRGSDWSVAGALRQRAETLARRRECGRGTCGGRFPHCRDAFAPLRRRPEPGRRADLVALYHRQPRPQQDSRRAEPAMFNNVTTITTIGLDAAAQPWLSGRLGDAQPSFAAYQSAGSWQQLPMPAGLKNLRVQVALSPNDVWATVTGGLVHWDGSSWQKTSVSWLDERTSRRWTPWLRPPRTTCGPSVTRQVASTRRRATAAASTPRASCRRRCTGMAPRGPRSSCRLLPAAARPSGASPLKTAKHGRWAGTRTRRAR